MWCVASHFHLMANSTQAPVQILIPAFLLPFLVFFFLSATAESGARNCCWGTLGRAHTPVSSICRTSGGYCIFFFWRRPSLRWNSHPWKSRAQSSAHSLSHFVFYIFSHTHLVFSIFFFFFGSSYRLKEAADTLQCYSLTHLFLIITLCPTYSDTIPCSAIIDRGITVFKIEDTKRASSRSSFDSAVNV